MSAPDDDSPTLPTGEDIKQVRAALEGVEESLRKSSDRLIPVVARKSSLNLRAVKP